MLICANCIKEPFLHDLVAKDNDEGQCDYCGDIYPAIPLEAICNYIKTAFEIHYTRTPDNPDDFEAALLRDKESDYEWEREGEPTIDAIMNAADIPEKAAWDIQKILADNNFNYESAEYGEEQEFSEDAYYIECSPDNSRWFKEWDHFKNTLKYETRFFSRKAVSKLSELFDNLDTMRTTQGQSLIVDAGPTTNYTHFYRARVFQDIEKLKECMKRPDKELSAPPSHFATAGRMNAHGISVFYGATSISTALAEVRPPVGSKVACARFEIMRPLKLLDLSALSKIHEQGSIFDPEYAYRLGRKSFLEQLSHQMTQPVMPDDEEFEYLITQAISDFLATEGKVLLDGILYPSVQDDGDGLNAVLFHKASKCQEVEFSQSTEFKAKIDHTPYDKEHNYIVIEKIRPEVETPDEETFPFISEQGDFRKLDLPNNDRRKDTLYIDLNSMEIHYINKVNIKRDSSSVIRLPYTDNDIPL